jgi:phage gp29-like protein
VGKGISLAELIWEITPTEGRVTSIEWVHPKKLTFADAEIPRLLTEDSPCEGIDLPPFKFLYHRYKARSGFDTRAGLLRTCAWWWLFKNYSVKDWMIFCERFGMPLRLGTYEAGASQKDIDALLAAVQALGVDGAGVKSKNTEIEIKEASGKTGSVAVYSSLVALCDKYLTLTVLGQELTSSAGSGGSGSYALGKVHDNVRQDIKRSDCEALSRTLRGGLLEALVCYNFGPDTPVPWFKFHYEPEEDKQAKATYFKTVICDIGLHVTEDHLYEELGIPKPEGGQVIVAPPTAGAAPLGLRLSQQTDAETQQQAQLDREDQAIDGLLRASLDEAQGIVERLGNQLDRQLQGRSSNDLADAILSSVPALPGTDLADLLARAWFGGNLFGRASVMDEALETEAVSRQLGALKLSEQWERMGIKGRPAWRRVAGMRPATLALSGISLEPLPFDEAIDWFADKIVLSADQYARLTEQARAWAFSVSGLTRIDLVADVYNSLQDALQQGIDMGEWRRDITSHFLERGWAGPNPWRLETIFLNNVLESYNAGRWAQQNDPYVLERFPLLVYKTKDDGRVRPEHHLWHNTVLPTGHPWWNTHYPQNGHRCRCKALSVSPGELKEFGLKLATEPPIGEPDPGWAFNPGKEAGRPQAFISRVRQAKQNYPPQLQRQLDLLAKGPGAKGGK